jgi:hypothetical protein
LRCAKSPIFHIFDPKLERSSLYFLIFLIENAAASTTKIEQAAAITSIVFQPDSTFWAIAGCGSEVVCVIELDEAL